LRADTVVLVLDGNRELWATRELWAFAESLNDLRDAGGGGGEHRRNWVEELQACLVQAAATGEQRHPPWIPFKEHRPADRSRVSVKRGSNRRFKESVTETDPQVANERAHKEFCSDWRTPIEELDEQIVTALTT
jgi:hypothetical protein